MPLWKKSRGKLGPLAPLLGTYEANGKSPMGPVRCERTFSTFGKDYVRLTARWEFGGGGSDKAYQEVAFFAPSEGGVHFWSFTNDGKRSEGDLADVTDLHPEAIGFHAQMPAGLARMAYWPREDGGYTMVVEAQTKKGWSRMVEHQYHRMESAG